jgi:hypothetical protein
VLGSQNVIPGSPAVLTSSDGIDWTERNAGTNNHFQGIAYGNNRFVVAAGFDILTSPDGVTWTTSSPGAGNYFDSIIYANGRFVATGTRDGPRQGPPDLRVSTISDSADGLNWSERSSHTDCVYLFSIAYGKNRFVALGYYGTTVQSSVVPSGQPAMGPVVLLSSGGLQLTVIGLAGQTYPIEASTNLMDWLTITNITLTDTTGQIIDPLAQQFGQRFYRAVLP